MISEEMFKDLALSFPGTETTPHMERTGFRVRGKRMYATYLASDHSTNIFLRPEEQAVFCKMDRKSIYALPNKWGEKGATTFELKTVRKEILLEALLSAYQDVIAGKKN